MNAAERERFSYVGRPSRRSVFGSVYIHALVAGTGLWIVGTMVFRYATGILGAPLVPYMFAFLPASFVITYVYYARHERQHRAELREQRRPYLEKLAADVAAGEVEEWEVEIRDALEVYEVEDEGAQYYIELEDGRVLFLFGQYLYDDRADDRFPNRRVRIARLPRSGEIIVVDCLGEFFPPSATLQPFAEEYPVDGEILPGPLSRYQDAHGLFAEERE